jgi:hypothetical protein
VGRAHPLHAPPFLVDQDGGVAARPLPQLGREAAELRGVVDVAGEEDEAPGIGVAQEAALPGGEGQAADA